MAEDNQVTEEEVTKENKNSIEKDKTPKQLENWSKRVEKGQTEEHANLARRLQREKDLQKKEARTPTPAAAHRPHPTTASCALFKFDLLSRSSPYVQLASAAFDDHYSPVKAADYIEQRLRPAIAYYQRRVPFNTYFGMAMKVLLLTAAVASSILARYNYSQLVVIATAFASMITAYSEFADAGRKVER